MADLKKVMEWAALLGKKVIYIDSQGEERLLYAVSMKVDGTFQLAKSNPSEFEGRCH